MSARKWAWVLFMLWFLPFVGLRWSASGSTLQRRAGRSAFPDHVFDGIEEFAFETVTLRLGGSFVSASCHASRAARHRDQTADVPAVAPDSLNRSWTWSRS